MAILACYFIIAGIVFPVVIFLTMEKLKEAKNKLSKYQDKYQPIIDVDAEYSKISAEIEKLQKDYKEKEELYQDLVEKISMYQEDADMIDIGLYEPSYSFDTSHKYKIEIDRNRESQKLEVKNGKAVYCSTEWIVKGSKSEGKKITNKTIKLVLKAFNGQCDSIIKNVNWNNVAKMETKIKKAFEDINKLCEGNDIHISETFLDLKIDELRLVYEYELKKYEEKEEQKRLKEQMREEEKLQKEIERKQKEIEEQQKKEEEIKRLQQEAFEQGRVEEAKKYQEEIDKLNEQIENSKRAVSQAQLTKCGNVYVISNIGSFGEDVFKIGMTRRLDPQERVDELGDASVPFSFDVHAMIKSDNAPELEKQLHEKFKKNSVNRVNYRKEFFRVSLEEIEKAVNEFTNSEIEFTKIAEAREYRETKAIINAENKQN